MTDIPKLAEAIMKMAEEDKGLVKSKLEEMIEVHLNAAPVSFYRFNPKMKEWAEKAINPPIRFLPIGRPQDLSE